MVPVGSVDEFLKALEDLSLNQTQSRQGRVEGGHLAVAQPTPYAGVTPLKKGAAQPKVRPGDHG